jgi:hypothetical protein
MAPKVVPSLGDAESVGVCVMHGGHTPPTELPNVGSDGFEHTGYICRLAHRFPQLRIEDIFKMARHATHLTVPW